MTKQEFESLTLNGCYVGAIGYAPHDKPVKFRRMLFVDHHVFIEGSYRSYHYRSITLPFKK